MEHNSDYKIPLSELLSILKANGYEVSIERILEIESVLLSTPLSGMRLSELKYIISPVLARNDEDQENIYQLIDDYIADKSKPAEKKPTGFRKWLKNRDLVFGLKVAVFIMIVTSAVLYYFFQRRENGKPSAYNPQQLLPRDTSVIQKAKTPADAGRTSPRSPGSPVNAVPVIASVEYKDQPLVSTRLNIILQVAAAFGFGLGGILYYFIFYEKKKRMEAKKKPEEGDENFAADKEENRNAAEQWVHAPLQFPSKDFLIQKKKAFSIIRANLKKAALSENRNLDIRRSVRATTQSAGFPSLVFDSQWKERKYLLLVDDREPGAHINHLLHYLVHFLEHSRIPIVKYYYRDDIRQVHSKSGGSVSLEDLSYDFPSHHLIIIGNCDSIFKEDMDLPDDQSSVSPFQRWMSRSVITPKPLVEWSYLEEQVQNSSFNLVPAEIDAIELLTKAISEGTQIKPQVLANRVREKYSVSQYDLSTVNGLREYLGTEELFQMICSLAVYPRLNWNVSLTLFAAILKKEADVQHATRLDYDTLLKIARIPWLHRAEWDNALRLLLLEFLKPQTEIIARETIIASLKEIHPFVRKDSAAEKELQAQVKINSFFLYAHDPQQYAEYAPVKNEFLDQWKDLDEWALKQRVSSGLMPVNSKGQTETVEEFVLKEEQFEKKNVTFLRAALLILPAAILYILFAAFRPPFVYLNSYEKVSFIAIVKKDEACSKQITKIIVGKLDRFDTTALKTYNGNSYIQVENTEYNRSVYLSFLFTDSTSVELPVDAKDSTVVVSLKCPG